MKLQITFYLLLVTTLSHALQEDLSLPFTSQNGQERYILENFFQNPDGTFMRNGFFIEVGAYNGVLYSNTYLLEKEFGWKGICIEPIPIMFTQLQHNRSCLCIQGCIADREGTALFREVCNGYNADSSDLLLSGLAEKYDPQHINLIENHYAAPSVYYEVQCYRLSQLLEEYNVEKVDFLSLDTEGNELEILKSLSDKDLERIDVICVEYNYPNQALITFLESKNFNLITRIDQDLIFRNIKYMQ